MRRGPWDSSTGATLDACIARSHASAAPRATAHAEYLFNRLFMDAAVRGIRDRDADGIVDPGERNRRQARKADLY